MLTGRSYAEAAWCLSFVPGEGGLAFPALRQRLECEGRRCKVVDSRDETGGEWPPRPFAPVHFVLVHQNDTGTAHYVVMDRLGDLLDPLGKRRPRRLDAYNVVQEVVGIW